MSDETGAPFRATFKGQGQNDPWTTVEGVTEDQFRDRLVPFMPDDMEADAIDAASLAELVAKAASNYVKVLNETPGISQQRDRAAAQPAAAGAAASGGSPAAGKPRPGLSSSLSPEDDGNYWIALPWTRDRAKGERQRQVAKDLGARYKPDDAPASIPLNSKGAPERPWCVHLRFVSEENVAELLRLHETGFAEIK